MLSLNPSLKWVAQFPSERWLNLSGIINLPFFGINKDKTFMPTVADTNELDKSKYKIVKKDVFVFSGMQTGRDVCIRLALYEKEDTILVSPAYTTFVVKDRSMILPEYLFIQFNRFQMDRYGWFLSDGSIRSNLDWNVFCDILIPLPDLETQQELVDTYNGLKALAEQNEALIKPLTEACQAYIVDCKKKYPEVELGGYIEEYDKRNYDKKIKAVKSVSVTKEFKETNAKVNKYELADYKIVPPRHLSYVQTTKNEKCFANALNTTNETYVVTQVNKVICSKDESVLNIGFLHLIFRSEEFDRYAIFNSWGSARETFDWNELCRVRIPLPPPEVQQAIVNIYNCAEEAKKIAAEARELMKTLCPALVQRAKNG
ncbi:restriction endonuclease subunit S [candidate division WWE3 bacterium]|uniref:Restriction endonuclease subunit S n=1 Tax=candidate division WWE3 bacterium TaxID=2053526 RepID=A0A7X9DLC3_UNCKA|nr:restriction endonuclease subunit S [candidate division WWE3 bacterium]